MLTRSQLEIINRKTLRYPLQIAEKDYFLALVMQIIASSSLGEVLVFKGGTALHHCYIDHLRFSEDLDFSSNHHSLAIEEVRNIFTPSGFLSIKKDYFSGATIKIERLQYTGPLSQPNFLKVEIDFLQNVILPPRIVQYNNVWGLDFSVRVMDEREICAEKIRAMSDRARYRDFYDLAILTETYPIDFQEIVSFIGQKEIRQPITKQNILRNFKMVETQEDAESSRIFYARQIAPSTILELIEQLPFDQITKTDA